MKAIHFCVGLDAATGETRWTLERPEDAVWASPLIVKSGERNFCAVYSQKAGIDLVDLNTGKVLDHAEGDTSSVFILRSRRRKPFTHRSMVRVRTIFPPMER